METIKNPVCEQNPQINYEAKEQTEILNKIRKDVLSEKEDFVIENLYYGGKTGVNIASQIGLSPARVHAIHHHAIKKLKKRINTINYEWGEAK
jgi:RNA polymerase sigma factor (sigma-70 family)